MTWDDYEQFATAEYLGYRTLFFDGVITLMSPSQNQEVIKDFIFLLIVAYYEPARCGFTTRAASKAGKSSKTTICAYALRDWRGARCLRSRLLPYRFDYLQR